MTRHGQREQVAQAIAAAYRLGRHGSRMTVRERAEIERTIRETMKAFGGAESKGGMMLVKKLKHGDAITIGPGVLIKIIGSDTVLGIITDKEINPVRPVPLRKHVDNECKSEQNKD